MNKITIVVLAAFLMASCSTVYKSGQTPDDVYFSPSMNKSSYVVMEDNDRYRSEDVPMNDRYLRMKSLSSRRRWSAFDEDNMYWDDPRWNSSAYYNGFSRVNRYGMGYSPFHNPYYMNPFSTMYYGQPYIVYNNYKNVSYVPRSSGPRMVNLNTYSPVRVSNYNPKMMNVSGDSRSTYRRTGSEAPRGGYNPNSGGNTGGSPARLFNNSSNGNSSSSGNSSSGSSSGSSSTKSSSAPVRTFSRGGGQ